jgi:hypothetical protein
MTSLYELLKCASLFTISLVIVSILVLAWAAAHAPYQPKEDLK